MAMKKATKGKPVTKMPKGTKQPVNKKKPKQLQSSPDLM